MIHVVPSKVPQVVVALGSCRSGSFLCGQLRRMLVDRIVVRHVVSARMKKRKQQGSDIWLGGLEGVRDFAMASFMLVLWVVSVILKIFVGLMDRFSAAENLIYGER